MSFPVVGDTGVLGQVCWFNSDVGCGEVEAWASIYGTPDRTYWQSRGVSESLGGDPLRFPFSSSDSFSGGQHVTFDVIQVAGEFGPRAVNVA